MANPAIQRIMMRVQTPKAKPLPTSNSIATNKVIVNKIAPTNKQTVDGLLTYGVKKPIKSSSIKIIGSSDFIQRINNALELLKNKDFEGYSLAVNYLRIIEENTKPNTTNTYVDVSTRTVQMLPIDSINIYWLASAIVHEARHVELYERKEIYYGTKGELDAIKLSIETLEKISGPKYLINYLKSLDGSHWKNANI
jgi:hypothetical protein